MTHCDYFMWEDDFTVINYMLKSNEVTETGSIWTFMIFPAFWIRLSFGTTCVYKKHRYTYCSHNKHSPRQVDNITNLKKERKLTIWISTLIGSEKEFSSIGLDDVSTVFVNFEKLTLDSNPSIEISILTAFLSKFATCKVISFFHMRNSITAQEEEILIHVLKCVTQWHYCNWNYKHHWLSVSSISHFIDQID